MFTLILLLLLTFAGLTVLLTAGGIFWQGYIYTEPSPGLSWRGPAAAAALTLFFALWCLLVANNRGSSPGDLAYDTWRFSPQVYMTREPVKRMWAVKKGEKKDSEVEVEYKLFKEVRAVGQVRPIYKETAPGGKVWSSGGVVAVLIEHDGQKMRFEPRAAGEGSYRQFVSPEGWVMEEYEDGLSGTPRGFRFGLFAANLFLNFFHLGLWFACLWLLLRFQWVHALLLGFVLWLVASLTLVPALLGQADAVAWAGPAGSASARDTLIALIPFVQRCPHA